MNDDIGELFARDGHLTMLSLDRYDTGELESAARHSIETHVEGCVRCRARLVAVTTPGPVIAPRLVAGRSTGSAAISVLAASAGLALAASAVLGLGSALWPSPQAARESTQEPAHNASSYTSVAEYSDSNDLDLDVSTRGDSLVVSPTGEGWLAVLAVDDGTETVAAVLHAAGPSSDAVSVAMHRRFAAHRVVALLCPGPVTLAAGEAFAPDPSCVVRDRDR